MDTVGLLCLFGLFIFCIGCASYAYMDFSVHGAKFFYDFKRNGTVAGYRRLVQEQRYPAWPLYVSVICGALGIMIVFGSILASNHLR